MTVSDRTRLTERQYLAIEALLGGGTHQSAATAAGVSRTTVTGWVNHNVHVIAELTQRRQQRADHLSDLISEALLGAVSLVKDRVADGDFAAAIALIRIAERSTLYRPPPADPVSPMTVTRKLAERLAMELVLDASVPEHAVFVVEDLSDAHQDQARL